MVLVPKSQPSVTYEAPTRAPILDFAGAMPTRDPMADAIGRGLAELGEVAAQIGERKTRRKVDSMMVAAENQMIGAYSTEEQKSLGERADGFSDRVAALYLKTGQDISSEAGPMEQARFNDKWNRQSTYYVNSASSFERQQLDAAQEAAFGAMAESSILKIATVEASQRRNTLNDSGSQLLNSMLIRSSENGWPQERTAVALTQAASALTLGYIQILAEDSPQQAMDAASNALENLEGNPYLNQSKALPQTNWSGSFPNPHPPGAGRLANANVRLTTVEFDGRHYVIPSMIGGKLKDTDTTGSGRPDYVDDALKNGLDKYPWFSSEAEADEWAKVNHGNITDGGVWGRFTQVLTQKQFDELENALAPRVEEESVSGFASGIQSAHPKNLPEQILATKGLPKNIRGSVIKRLEVENKLRVAADDIARAQADIPHIQNVLELATIHPGTQGAENAYRAATAAASQIRDGDKREEVLELITGHFIDGDDGLSKYADIRLTEEFAQQKTPSDRVAFAKEQLPLLGERLLNAETAKVWKQRLLSVITADTPSARSILSATAFSGQVEGALKRLGLTGDTHEAEAYDIEQLMRRALEMEQARLQDDKGDVKYKMSLTEAAGVIGKVALTLPETEAGRIYGRNEIKVNIRDVLQGKAAPGWVLPPRVVRDVAMSMGLIVDTDTETDVDPDDITPQAVFKWLIEDKWDGPGFPSIHWLDATLDGIVSAELAEAEAEAPIGDRPRRGRVYDGR